MSPRGHFLWLNLVSPLAGLSKVMRLAKDLPLLVFFGGAILVWLTVFSLEIREAVRVCEQSAEATLHHKPGGPPTYGCSPQCRYRMVLAINSQSSRSSPPPRTAGVCCILLTGLDNWCCLDPGETSGMCGEKHGSHYSVRTPSRQCQVQGTSFWWPSQRTTRSGWRPMKWGT